MQQACRPRRGEYTICRKAHMNRSLSVVILIRKIAMAAAIIASVMFVPNGYADLEPSDAVQKGRAFLLNTNLDLLPEYRGANVYWLFHDNYLAAKVLAVSHPQTSQRITAAIHREGIQKSGKIELIFGETEKPLPFRCYQLTDVRRDAEKIIRTEVATDRVLDGWQEYADLLLMACIAEKSRPIARQHWKAATQMWDGKGFLDAAARHDLRYSTYKLGLALLAASHLSPPVEPPEGLLEKLLSLQDDSGGWITDYDATGKKIGFANVETTSLSILGIEAVVRYRRSPVK
jgi:hypothetical protein